MGSLYGLRKKYATQRLSKMIRVDEDDPIGEVEPSFSYRDVVIKRGKDPEEFYELLSEIGRGKFGTVYHCKEKSTGLELAAKFVAVNRREERRNAEREVDIMRQLQHPRLIQLYDAFDSGKTMCVILELILGGELFERVIDDDFILTEKACTVFMRQICEGIEFIHQQNILHLDMKPENILCLTKSGNRIKIIDFGLARKFDPSKKLQVLFGTPEFVAPEVVNFDEIGFGTDMWSIGVICYVLLSGLSPFMGETDIETMANVTIAKYDFDDEAFNEISEDAKDFIRKLLVKDKQNRMTAQQCVAHKWLYKCPPTQEKKKEESDKIQKHIENNIAQPEELDVTKDNLRLFVERWSEHPNSPYLFDIVAHEITPCISLTNCNGLESSSSQQSIGGCSPSPCGSLSSFIDSTNENDINSVFQTEKYPANEFDEGDVTSYNTIHSLERRASDSSCFVNKKVDICRKVNLAEEIKKLSDHLYMLSTMNTDLVNNNIKTDSVKDFMPCKISDNMDKCQNKVIDVKESSSKINNSYSRVVQKYNNVSVNNVTNKETHTLSSLNSDSNLSSQNIKICLNGTVKQETCSNDIPRANANTNKKSVSPLKKNENYLVNDKQETNFFSHLPWARKKFKISNLSRDVPLVPDKTKSIFNFDFNKNQGKFEKHKTELQSEIPKENFKNTSNNFYKTAENNCDITENASNTKDLLLHLLDEWGESQTAPKNLNSGRHKSVSMEWSEVGALASKSMNSLNTFFKRQSSISTNVKKKQEAISSSGLK